MIILMHNKIDELSILYKNNPTEENFKKLILEYRPKIRNNVKLFVKMFRRPDWVVDDISSEVELHLFKTIDKYFDPMIGEFESWAFILTKQYVSLALNKNMYSNNEVSIDDTSVMEFISSSDTSQVNKNIINDIKCNLYRLDATTRKCIQLVFFEDMNYEEASKIINMCPSAICKRCKKGINFLKVILDK